MKTSHSPKHCVFLLFYSFLTLSLLSYSIFESFLTHYFPSHSFTNFWLTLTLLSYSLFRSFLTHSCTPFLLAHTLILLTLSLLFYYPLNIVLKLHLDSEGINIRKQIAVHQYPSNIIALSLISMLILSQAQLCPFHSGRKTKF